MSPNLVANQESVPRSQNINNQVSKRQPRAVNRLEHAWTATFSPASQFNVGETTEGYRLPTFQNYAFRASLVSQQLQHDLHHNSPLAYHERLPLVWAQTGHCYDESSTPIQR
jgi:hypothetical protein